MPDSSAAPDDPAVISARARQYAHAAIGALVAALDSPSPGERIAAAIALLDRGHGRPVQPVVFDTTGVHVEVHASEPPSERPKERENRPNGEDGSARD